MTPLRGSEGSTPTSGGKRGRVYHPSSAGHERCAIQGKLSQRSDHPGLRPADHGDCGRSWRTWSSCSMLEIDGRVGAVRTPVDTRMAHGGGPFRRTIAEILEQLSVFQSYTHIHLHLKLRLAPQIPLSGYAGGRAQSNPNGAKWYFDNSRTVESLARAYARTIGPSSGGTAPYHSEFRAHQHVDRVLLRLHGCQGGEVAEEFLTSFDEFCREGSS
jgi:hypothetical protein